MTPQAVYGLGHVLNDWQEDGRGVRACEVCGGRWENQAVLRECPGGPRPGAEIRRIRCGHCKVEPVIVEVRQSESGYRSVSWLTNSAECQLCSSRLCSATCPVACSVARSKESEEEKSGN